MIDGFLGTRATIMFDVVTTALIAFLPTLAWSIWRVRRGNYAFHRRMQIALGALLFLIVAFFEVDIQVTKRRVEGGWRALTTESPYRGYPLDTFLRVHLVFAITTALLWVATLAHALMQFSRPPVPGSASRWHKRLGWGATIGIFMTAISGWIFYYLAFVARNA